MDEVLRLTNLFKNNSLTIEEIKEHLMNLTSTDSDAYWFLNKLYPELAEHMFEESWFTHTLNEIIKPKLKSRKNIGFDEIDRLVKEYDLTQDVDLGHIFFWRENILELGINEEGLEKILERRREKDKLRNEVHNLIKEYGSKLGLEDWQVENRIVFNLESDRYSSAIIDEKKNTISISAGVLLIDFFLGFPEFKSTEINPQRKELGYGLLTNFIQNLENNEIKGSFYEKDGDNVELLFSNVKYETNYHDTTLSVESKGGRYYSGLTGKCFEDDKKIFEQILSENRDIPISYGIKLIDSMHTNVRYFYELKADISGLKTERVRVFSEYLNTVARDRYGRIFEKSGIL